MMRLISCIIHDSPRKSSGGGLIKSPMEWRSDDHTFQLCFYFWRIWSPESVWIKAASLSDQIAEISNYIGSGDHFDSLIWITGLNLIDHQWNVAIHRWWLYYGSLNRAVSIVTDSITNDILRLRSTALERFQKKQFEVVRCVCISDSEYLLFMFEFRKNK